MPARCLHLPGKLALACEAEPAQHYLNSRRQQLSYFLIMASTHVGRIRAMSVKLHRSGFDYAKQLIEEGKVVLDERDDWSEHQPSAKEENEFIRRHGITEFGRWHLGIDDEQDENNK